MNNFLKGVLLLQLLLFVSISGIAQSYSETALLFSRTTPNLTGRFSALGGAGVSLGGDLSSAFLNPAGLGMYNKGEATASLGFTNNQTTSTYFGDALNSGKSGINIPFFGINFFTEKDGEPVISGSFAVTYNRVNDFNRTMSYQSRNTTSSIIDYFLDDAYDADGYPIDPRDLNIPTNLAFETYLIDTIRVDNQPDYFSALGLLPDPADFRHENQKETIETTGGENQWSFSYGINISDKYFLGGGLGLRNVRFQNKKSYSEFDFEYLDAAYQPINGFTLQENLTVTGSGYNFTLGGIARPVEGLQVGVAYESPTWYELSDVYSASLSADWNNFDYYLNGQTILNNISASLNEDIVTEYKLRTPGKISGGVTYFIGKKGFVTADVESTNFGKSVYTSKTQGVGFDSDNNSIKSLYAKTLTYKVGTEFRSGNLRFRAGGSYRPDPFISRQNDTSRSLTTLTGGIGYRKTKYNIDVALTYGSGNQSYRPYRIPSADSPVVTSKLNNLLLQVAVSIPLQ
jgi:hypothetical protein